MNLREWFRFECHACRAEVIVGADEHGTCALIHDGSPCERFLALEDPVDFMREAGEVWGERKRQAERAKRKGAS